MPSKNTLPPLDYERASWSQGVVVCGLDEAGRGPLFGPLVVGAVVLSADNENVEAYDSKSLSRKRREELAEGVKNSCADWSVGAATALEIDTLGLPEALRLAAVRALGGLKVQPGLLLIDGKHDFTKSGIKNVMLVKGESKSRSIAAASLVAKVARDSIVADMCSVFPGYGLDRHGGYGTKEHMDAIKVLGPTPEHRWSFAPIRMSR